LKSVLEAHLYEKKFNLSKFLLKRIERVVQQRVKNTQWVLRRLTRLVGEKIAQNVAQYIFAETM
jgi:hypothetical protein